MKIALVKTWCEALRSGKYQQGERYLKVKDEEGDKFCCLGVLSEIAKDLPEIKATDWKWDSKMGEWVRDNGNLARSLLPDEVAEALHIPVKMQILLATQNDDGIPFPEIANKIESLYK